MQAVWTLLLHGRPQRQRWFVHDPVGIAVAMFSWSLMVVSLCGTWMSLWHWFDGVTVGAVAPFCSLTISIGMCMWSHWMVMTTNPGVVPRAKVDQDPSNGGSGAASDDSDDYDVEEEESEMPLDEFENHEDDGSLLVFCDQCNVYRPTRAMHCDTCERCVVLLDHHCPWVNNCVGIGNQRHFLQFLFYIAITSVQVLLMVCAQRMLCTGGKAYCGFQSQQFPGRLGVWLLAASCAFGLFCSVMLTMELYTIDEDMTYTMISDRLHVRTGCKSRSRVERHLSVVFNSNGFAWSWFLPLPARWARDEWEIVGGFSS